MERAKLNPYREIGRVLADHLIGPMNQPEALDRVLNFREEIRDYESTIAALDRETAMANPLELRISLGLWGVIVLALLFFVGALL
jgi:hypothetical protein